MQLIEQRPGNHNFVQSVDASSVTVNRQRHTSSLILGAHLLQPDWPVRNLDDLDHQRIEPLLKHSPEVVILGIGDRQAFVDVRLQRAFFVQGIGLECMTLAAACYTFNVLMSENRRALAGLILPNGGR